MQHATSNCEVENDDLGSKVSNLSNWMRQNGLEENHISSIDVQVSNVSSEGRCLMANRRFSVGSPLIQIPNKFLINYRFALADSKLNSFFQWYSSTQIDKPRRLTRYDALLLLLINSRLNPHSSEFMGKFAATLPSDFDTPEYFDPELVELLPKHVKFEVKSRLSELRDKYESLLKQFERYADLFEMGKFTWDLFKWAFCSMNSRVFYMDEKEVCKSDEIELGREYFGDLAEMSLEQTKFLLSITSFKGFILSLNYFITFLN